MAIVDQVADIVAPLADSLGLAIYDVEHNGGVLKISIEGSASPVGTDSLTKLTRMISSALDEADPLPGSYTLEVTSPGLERKLRTSDHYAGAIGERIKVKLVPGAEIRRVEGELVAADASSLSVRDDAGHDHTVPLGEVQTARTMFEWKKAPKPGGPRGRNDRSGGGRRSAPSEPDATSSRAAERSAR